MPADTGWGPQGGLGDVVPPALGKCGCIVLGQRAHSTVSATLRFSMQPMHLSHGYVGWAVGVL